MPSRFGSGAFGAGVTPDGKTVFVTNFLSNTVSYFDVKTKTHKPPDIAVGTGPLGGAITPDGKTGFVVNNGSNSVSTIDLKTRTKYPTDIPVGPGPIQMAITPDGKTGFVDNFGGPIASANTPMPESIGTVSTIDLKTRTKDPTDITVGPQPGGPGVTPDGKTVFVASYGNGTVSTIDVKTRTKNPTDIPVGVNPTQSLVTPCRR
jgi:YVTN family beta-propeller protein